MENVTEHPSLDQLTSFITTATSNVKSIYRIKEISTSSADEDVPLTNVTHTEDYTNFNVPSTSTEFGVDLKSYVSDTYDPLNGQIFQTTTEKVTSLELAEDHKTTSVYDLFNFTEIPRYYNGTEVTEESRFSDTEIPYVTDSPGSSEAFDFSRITKLSENINFTDPQESLNVTKLSDYFTVTELSDFSRDAELPKSSIVTEISDFFSPSELPATQVPEHIKATDILDYGNISEPPANITELSAYPNVSELPGYASDTELSAYFNVTEPSGYTSITELSEYSSNTELPEYSNNTDFSKAFDLIDLYSTSEASSLSDTSDFNTTTDVVNASTAANNIFRLKDPRSTTELLSSFSWNNATNWIYSRSTPRNDYITEAVTTLFNGNSTIFDDGIFYENNNSHNVVPDILNTTSSGFTTGINESQPVSVSHYTHSLELVCILAILLIIIIVTATTGNILVLATITTNPKMKTRTHMFLFNLAIADLIMALFVVPFSLITLLEGRWVFGDVMCHLNGFLTGLSAHASCHLLMYISIHKCITLTSPYTEMSRGSVLAMLVAAWLWPMAYNMAAVIGWTEIVHKAEALQCGPVVPSTRSQTLHSVVNLVCNEALPFFILLYCYARIFCYVSSTSKKVSSCLPDPKDRAARVQQQKQMVYTLLVILLCFLLCWTPYLVYSVNIQQYALNEVPPWLRILNPIAYLFGYLNSACNPIIYALRSSTFRESYKRILCPRKGNRQKVRNQENGYLKSSKKRTPKSPKFNGVRPTIELVRDEKCSAVTARDEDYELTEDFSLLSGNSNLQGSIERELWKRGLDLNFISDNPNRNKKSKSRHHSRVADMFHRIKRRADKSSMSRCNSGEWSPTKTISPYRSYESLEGEDIPRVRDLKDRRKSDVNIGSTEAEMQAFEKLKKGGLGSSKLSLSRKGCSSKSTDSLSRDKHQNIPLQVWVLRDDVV